jgi:hypothetical protein
MSSDSRLLRDDTKVKMAELCLRYLASCRELGVSAEDLGSVGSILDLILDVSDSSLSQSQSNSSTLVVSLLSSYNDFIQSDLVVGQRPVSVLNQLFRATHYSVGDNTNNNDKNLTLIPPRSALEEYLNHPSQQVSLPLGVLLGVSKVSIVESRFTTSIPNSRLNNTNQSHLALLSVPIELRFDSLPCNSSDSNSSASCVTQITLLKLFTSSTTSGGDLRRMLVAVGSSETDGEFVEVECVSGDLSTHNVSCSNGEEMGLTCVGSPGVLRRQCPVVNSSSVCVVVGRSRLSGDLEWRREHHL